jgi:hypothetical protein
MSFRRLIACARPTNHDLVVTKHELRVRNAPFGFDVTQTLPQAEHPE